MDGDKGKRSRRHSEILVTAASSESQRLSAQTSEDAPVCWICLGEQPGLLRPCACPRFAHATCLARWQLQSAGSRRETHCEFCDRMLPDWKKTLTPTCGANAPAVMNVNFDGRTYSFEVRPGPDGYAQFTDAIRRAFSLPDDSELNITFTCDEPTVVEPLAPLPAAPLALPPLVVPTAPPPPPPPPPPPAPVHFMDAASIAGSLLTLQGAGAYDAAVHCASVSAARRMLQQRYLSEMLPMAAGAGAFRPDMALSGQSFTAAAGTASPEAAGAATSAAAAAAAAAAPAQGLSGPSDGRPKKRLPAALTRKLRNFCDMLTLGSK